MLRLVIEPIEAKTESDLAAALERISDLIDEGYTSNLDEPRFRLEGEIEEDDFDDET